MTDLGSMKAQICLHFSQVQNEKSHPSVSEAIFLTTDNSLLPSSLFALEEVYFVSLEAPWRALEQWWEAPEPARREPVPHCLTQVD